MAFHGTHGTGHQRVQTRKNVCCRGISWVPGHLALHSPSQPNPTNNYQRVCHEANAGKKKKIRIVKRLEKKCQTWPGLSGVVVVLNGSCWLNANRFFSVLGLM